MNPLNHLSEPAKHWLDAGAIGFALTTLFGMLPQIAALLTVIWFALRIAIGVQEWRLNHRKLSGK